MRLRDIIGLILALVLAMGVALLTRVFLTKEGATKKEEPVKEVSILKILVTGKELNEGEDIKPGDLVWQTWPEYAMNTGYIKEGTVKVEDLRDAIVLQHLGKGEPVAASDFIKPGEKGILAAILTPGKRAISIDVTPQAVNSGLIYPGDYVDVIMSKLISGSTGNQYGQSRTIVRNVKVLALDFEMSNTHQKPKTVPKVATLEVTSSQAEQITSAVKEGTLSLSLHSISAKESAQKETPTNTGMVILMRGKEKNEVQVPE